MLGTYFLNKLDPRNDNSFLRPYSHLLTVCYIKLSYVPVFTGSVAKSVKIIKNNFLELPNSIRLYQNLLNLSISQELLIPSPQLFSRSRACPCIRGQKIMNCWLRIPHRQFSTYLWPSYGSISGLLIYNIGTDWEVLFSVDYDKVLA